MSKKVCIVANLCLVVWFFFDMIGFQIGNFILVERAWKEDGIFFVIYIALFPLLFIKRQVWKILSNHMAFHLVYSAVHEPLVLYDFRSS